MYAAIKQPSTSISHAQQAPTYIQQAATSVLSAPATASSHRKHPQQAATASSHINLSHQSSSCQLPASMLLPATSKQAGKQPHQAATHSKQQAATSFLSAPASSHISISYHQAVCYQQLASTHPHQAATPISHAHQASTHIHHVPTSSSLQQSATPRSHQQAATPRSHQQAATSSTRHQPAKISKSAGHHTSNIQLPEFG